MLNLCCSSLVEAIQKLYSSSISCNNLFEDGVCIRIEKLNFLSPIITKKMEPIIKAHEPKRIWWKSDDPMNYVWRATNMVFPQKIYEERGKKIANIGKDPRFWNKFSYTKRMMHAGNNHDLDLISWFLRRMKSKWACTPYYWLPTFDVDEFHSEARQGKGFRLVKSAAGGNFCMAAMHFRPVRKTKTISTFVVYRNWAVSRIIPNLNGIAYLLKALQKEVKGWKFTWTTVVASLFKIDWPKNTLSKLVKTFDS